MNKYEAYIKYSVKIDEPLEEAWKWSLKASKCIECAADDLIDRILSYRNPAIWQVVDSLPVGEEKYPSCKEITKAYQKAGYVRACQCCKKRHKNKQ